MAESFFERIIVESSKHAETKKYQEQVQSPEPTLPILSETQKLAIETEKAHRLHQRAVNIRRQAAADVNKALSEGLLSPLRLIIRHQHHRRTLIDMIMQNPGRLITTEPDTVMGAWFLRHDYAPTRSTRVRPERQDYEAPVQVQSGYDNTYVLTDRGEIKMFSYPINTSRNSEYSEYLLRSLEDVDDSVVLSFYNIGEAWPGSI